MLDYGPLHRRFGLRDRLRAIGRDNVMVMGSTVVALLVVVPPVVLVSLVATGNATDPGGIACLVLLMAAGAYATWDVLAKAGSASALHRFADANDLDAVPASTAPTYAGSLFADGSSTIRQAVRTRERRFTEIGDRFPTGSRNSAGATVSELYVRLRLEASLLRTPYGVDLVTPDLHQRLTAFAGDYAIETTGFELTLFGTRPLEPAETGRVEEAFSVADALRARAAAVLVPAEAVETASGIPVPVAGPGPDPDPATAGRPPRAWRVVAGTLGLLVLGPFAIAAVLSSTDDYLRREAPWAIPIVVTLVVGATLVVVRWILRKSVTPGGGRRERDD